MATLLSSSSESGTKKWYQKPENLTGTIFLIILGVIAYKYGAGLLSGALSMLGFLWVSIIITVIVAFLITQRRLIGTVWQVLMYKFTNMIYSIDPIAIAWSKVERLKDKRAKINKQVERIKGALYNVTSQIESNQKSYDLNAQKIQTLSKKENMQSEVNLLASENVRLENWINDLLPIETTMKNMQAGLKKLDDAANYVIRDKVSELTLLEKRYNSVKIGWAAVREAQGIYGQNSKDRQELEKLIGMADEDMNNKLAEMDRFMEMAAPVFMEADIEKSINDEKAQQMIQKITSGVLDKAIDNITAKRTVLTKSLEKGSEKQTIAPMKEAMKVSTPTKSTYNLD